MSSTCIGCGRGSTAHWFHSYGWVRLLTAIAVYEWGSSPQLLQWEWLICPEWHPRMRARMALADDRNVTKQCVIGSGLRGFLRKCIIPQHFSAWNGNCSLPVTHWKPKISIMLTFSSLMAQGLVVMTWQPTVSPVAEKLATWQPSVFSQ